MLKKDSSRMLSNALECSRPLLTLYGGVPTWDKQICKIGWVFWDGGNIRKLDRVWFECDSILIHMHAQVPPPYPGETWSRYVRYVKIRSTLGKYVSESRLLWLLTACFLLSHTFTLFIFIATCNQYSSSPRIVGWDMMTSTTGAWVKCQYETYSARSCSEA